MGVGGKGFHLIKSGYEFPLLSPSSIFAYNYAERASTKGKFWLGSDQREWKFVRPSSFDCSLFNRVCS